MRDWDVRHALHSQVLARHRTEPDTLVLDELGIRQGDTRVDIAVINGMIHGYEIKSERDTLERLPGQVQLFSTALDRVTLVVDQRHLARAEPIVPHWWGLLVVRAGSNGQVLFSEARPPAENHGLDPQALAEFLWREEALAVLEKINAADGVRHRPRRFLYERLVQRLSLQELGALVRATMKARADWRAGVAQS